MLHTSVIKIYGLPSEDFKRKWLRNTLKMASWRKASLKRRQTSRKVHGATTQKTAIFISAAMIT